MNNLLEISPETETLQAVQANIAYHYGIFPKSIDNNIIELYISEESIATISKDEIELILGKKVVFIKTEALLINEALAQYYRISDENQERKEFKPNNDFLKSLILEAKSTGSSDIHFEIYKDSARVRFRIDGKLIERYKIEMREYLALVNKVKIEASLNITEKRLPQDGRINLEDFDIRVSVLPTLYGEKIVMRILGKDAANLTFEKLGMSEAEQQTYLNAVGASRGIILISGPTGSGKTTTLYATLKLLNQINNNILTIEDPIEYTMPGINQVQLREDLGLTFASALKTFLRQDPDIIMLGEIRDKNTAQMAIRASLTGHLVLSTIHTNSAIGTISRLLDMGVPAFLIAETVRISVAQRLVRRLCKHCKIKTTKTDPIVNSYRPLEHHFRSVGCKHCFQTGYSGRIAIYELVPMTQNLEEKVKNGELNLASSNYKRLSEKAFELVEKGVTTLEEIYPMLIEDKLKK